MNILPKNHYSLQIIENVIEICQPFLQRYHLSAFFYARLFDDGSTYLLTSHREWYKHHIKKKFKATPVIPPSPEQRFYYYLNKNTLYQPVLDELIQLFNLDHLFYSFEYYQGYHDVFCFCSNPQQEEVINFYINKKEILEQFKLYFKYKAKYLIKNSNKNRILLPKEMQTTIASRPLFSNSSIKNSLFTKRELECLQLLQYGNTMKQIGEQLHISPRTVEFFLNRIKNKLNCRTKSQILERLAMD